MNRIGHIAAWSALTGYLMIIAVVVVAGAAWPGYDHLRQYISELGATGAPHGQEVSVFGFLIPGALLIAFAALTFLSLRRSALSLLGFVGVALFYAGYFFSGFYRCDFGCPVGGGSHAQRMHELFGVPGYFAAPATLALLAFASRRWQGAGPLFPLGLLCAAVALVSLPLLGAGFEFHGLAQRALEGAMAAWVIACAAYVLKRR